MSRNGYPKYVLDQCLREFLIVSSQLNYYFQKKKDSILKDFYLFAVFRCFIVANSQRTEGFSPQTHG